MYNGKEVKFLKITGTEIALIEKGVEYFLLLEYLKMEDSGVLWANLIDFEKIDELFAEQ